MQSKIGSLLVATLLTAGSVSFALAQNKRRSDPLAEMVATERAFSRMSEETGVRESFTEFIAEDGILFRPRAVLGKKWMKDNPLPASTTRPLLVWQPILAGISRAGDLGYSTGPWQLKNDIKDANFSAFGNFMTVWKKQPDGKWKFVIDLGISNPAPETQSKLVSVSARGRFRRMDPAKAKQDLLNTERAFSKVSAERGAVESFLSYAATDVRLLRNRHQPFIGRKAAVRAMPSLAVEFSWTPSSADVSISGDLGYSYGLYQLRTARGSINDVEVGNYLRVWRKIGRRWKLILDVIDPHPLEKKP